MGIFLDNLAYDITAVYYIQKLIIDYLKSKFQIINKLFYCTDGAGQHFENKSNFQNLIFHYEHFSVEAEWHFHATAHGKNGCD